MKQDYSNHVRSYTPHHFVFYPIVLGLMITSAVFIFKYPGRAWEWTAITIIFFLIGWLSFMMRQHYALNNQDRIVRLEMRLRYYQLTQNRLEEIEPRLSFSQLAALRFASDSELPGLVQKTLDENLSPSAIKRSIINWLPDTMRV
jgi:energy-coupling factor transporter transmembrane protein EcfT